MATWAITDGSYKGFTFNLAIPKSGSSFGVISQEVTNERRLQVSEKALIDGADVEDFGRKSKIFTAEVIFFGGDYRDNLKTFEDLLNDPTSGTLILPDHAAVNAKYMKHSRKSAASDGDATLLSVTWIEDRSTAIQPSGTNVPQTEAQKAAALAAKANAPNTEYGIAAIQDKAQSVLSATSSVQSAIANNSVLKRIQSALNASSATRVSINSVANLTRDTVSLINTTAHQIEANSAAMNSAVQGLINFTDLLKFDLGSFNPTRFNTALGLVDFVAPTVTTTTTVTGTATVVAATKVTPANVQSYPDAVKTIQPIVVALVFQKQMLEQNTAGATPEASSSIVTLLNLVTDLLTLIDIKSTKQVLTVTNTSLLEVCFENKIGTSDLNRVYKLNYNLDDNLDIPPMTVVSL